VRGVDAHELLVAVEIAKLEVGGAFGVEPADGAAAHFVKA
jgi:hypothetical protein